MWRDEVDRVLRDDYLGDLGARPIEEVRAMRDECRDVEDKVSYLRRLIQGRLDIVVAELRRRAAGGSPGDLGDLVDRLPQILSDKVHAGGTGRLPSGLVAPDDDDLTADLDRVAGAGVLDRLPDLSDDAAAALARDVEELERQVSEARKGLFGRIDALNGELARRYATGEADPGRLLGG
ncbi:MAG: aerial mycelium formation protein [Acidimicrobiales bacterium]